MDLTDFAGVPFLTEADLLQSVDDWSEQLAERLDYLFGESGDNTITPSAASTKTTKVIPFGRTYATPPRVVHSMGRDAMGGTIGAGAVSLWVDDVTTTDFTIAIHATSTVTREFTWIAKPKRTDATP